MDELKDWYRSTLKARVDALKAAGRALREKSPEAVESVRRLAHTLRGSGATYGFPEISEAARRLEESSDALMPSLLLELVEVLRHAGLGAPPDHRTVILVIDDDPHIGHLLEVILAGPDREIVLTRSAGAAELLLQERKVDLILLDLVLPDTDGRNFLVKLRERASTATIPVVVLSAKSGNQPQTECFALGADGYFEKPFEQEILAATVSSKLQKAGEARRESRLCILTGLPNRAACCENFQRLGSLCARKGEPFALGILDFDRFKGINDTFGHLCGDLALRQASQLLQEALRKSDILSRWGGEELVALFPNTDAEGAKAALNKALEALRREIFTSPDGRTFSMTFSAGIAEVAPGALIEGTVAEADRWLYLAKAQGRNRVLGKDDASQTPRRKKKILLVESEEVVATLIKNRLAKEGFDIVTALGPEGVPALAEKEGVSLCVLDLPEAALPLLPALRGRPATAQLPVLLLTELGKDKEVTRGFELGADDYLVKPFSPFELVARVRNLLRRHSREAPPPTAGAARGPARM